VTGHFKRKVNSFKEMVGFLRIIYDAYQEAEYPQEIIVQPFKKKRSSQANARLWEILTQISNAKPGGADYPPEVWLEYYKDKFLKKSIVTINGNPKVVSGSSSHLNTQEFNDFMSEIEADAATELGVQLELL